jgi:hypothetical protein
MYGTVGRLQIKPGRLDDLKRYIQQFETTLGVLAASLVGKDGSTSDYTWTIVWTDKAAHDAANSRPDALAEYQRLLDMLAQDPEWHSGEIVYGMQTQANIYG